MLVQLGKLKPAHVDEYKDEHPIKLDRVYADMYVDKETNPSMMKLLKFALLITPNTANVEREFSILTLLCTKQRNQLSPKNIDRLMRIILLGPEKIEDAVWENLINKKKKKTLWPLFMDGVQLPQGYSHFEEAVYFLPLSSHKFLVLILPTFEG